LNIAGPPVISVPVEYYRVVITDAFTADQLAEGVFVDVVTSYLMLQLILPVDLYCPRNVPNVIEQDVFIGFHDTDVGVVAVLGNPVSTHEHFRVNILCHRIFLL
jgi:hypothetical protein